MRLRDGLIWLAGTLLAGLFLALGLWQLQRLDWKTDLIARVEARVHAEPVAPPAPSEWAAVQADAVAYEYRRVRLEGHFLHQHERLVQAVTELGSGYWVLVPLQLDDGSVVLVNRGFVPSRAQWLHAGTAARCAGPVTVSGLLRRSEPGGGFLRHNDPLAQRWYSRDVPALAASAGLAPASVAPYFVDAGPDTPCAAGQGPVGGLTVLRFTNNHLSYALTWLALALMALAATVFVSRDGRRRALAGQSGA